MLLSFTLLLCLLSAVSCNVDEVCKTLSLNWGNHSGTLDPKNNKVCSAILLFCIGLDKYVYHVGRILTFPSSFAYIKTSASRIRQQESSAFRNQEIHLLGCLIK